MATTINDFAFDYEQFDFAHLLAVLPVAHTAPIGDIALTVTSLELYQAGFAANLLLEQPADPQRYEQPQQHEPPLLFHAMPAISARDDRGVRYEGRLRSGYGGGGRVTDQQRQVHNFAPALDPDTRTLTFEVVLVTRLGWSTIGEPVWTDADIVAGPWHATFTLPERT